MSDFIVTNATTKSGHRVDIEIRGGQIDTITDTGTSDEAAFDQTKSFDAEERLVTSSFTEPHTHLDSAMTVDAAEPNETGTLEEGWELWQALRKELDSDDVKRRARQTLEWFLLNGITRVRSHVDVTAPHWENLDALLEVREEFSDVIDLQLVAFPIDSVSHDPETIDQIEQALKMGVDVVGGLPHGEHGREAGVEHVRRVVELADEHDRPLDLHIDETDDPNSRFTEILAVEARKRGLGSRTTASHVTAMHSYPNSYAQSVASLLAETGVSVITNPLANSILQGRYDDYPRRRGYTRIRELRELGVSVGIGQDDIIDSTYQYGDGDPLTAAHVLVHFAHMNRKQDIDGIWQMLLEESATAIGAKGKLEEGAEGSIVVHGGTNPFDVLRTQAPRALVVKNGVPVAKGSRSSTICIDGEREVDFTSYDS